MKANQKFKNLKENKSAYQQVVGGLIALLLTIIVGVLVFWSVNTGMGGAQTAPWGGQTLDPGYEVEAGVRANLSRNSTLTMATTVFGLAPLIALVVVAAIILGVILGFGGGGGRKGGI